MTTHFGDWIPGSRSNKHEIRVCCPHCAKSSRTNFTPDHGYHLWINQKKRVGHCFRCEWTGKIGGAEEMSVLGLQDDPGLEALEERVTKLFQAPQPATFDLNLISWPCDPQESPLGYQYMINRGFTPEEIQRFSFRVGKPYWDGKLSRTVNRWCGRVIFPFFDSEGACTYIIGRTYVDRDPKYLNCSASKGSVVYGIESIRDEQCIICEGFISAWAAAHKTGVSSVAVLGKTILDTQVYMIQSRAKKVWTSWDGDVPDDIKIETERKLLKAGLEVWSINLPPIHGADPDSTPNYREHFEKAEQRRIAGRWML